MFRIEEEAKQQTVNRSQADSYQTTDVTILAQ
jgi:hypothetical protein